MSREDENWIYLIPSETMGANSGRLLSELTDRSPSSMQPALTWSHSGAFCQKMTLSKRITSSSRENIVSPNGTRGAAVTIARRVMSCRPKGTGLISRTIS